MCGSTNEYLNTIENKLWYKNYLKLRHYFSTHQHTNVSKNEDKSLYRWCKAQRKSVNNTMFNHFEPKTKIQLLDALYFNWNEEKAFKTNMCIM